MTLSFRGWIVLALMAAGVGTASGMALVYQRTVGIETVEGHWREIDADARGIRSILANAHAALLTPLSEPRQMTRTLFRWEDDGGHSFTANCSYEIAGLAELGGTWTLASYSEQQPPGPPAWSYASTTPTNDAPPQTIYLTGSDKALLILRLYGLPGETAISLPSVRATTCAEVSPS